jgi:hypothetical protein
MVVDIRWRYVMVLDASHIQAMFSTKIRLFELARDIFHVACMPYEPGYASDQDP